ncbi:helix-turn-helix domain-containing protein [Micromonospora krabiensis]|uniref:WD40 repeat n=1 Tax=Micromonospora krabiensis TaxID=307121 RepID=A0A1C3NDZ2_9ACTN|nr:helix-turn-helix domain-containing protein [Micromonospora krabiensis]SBV30814.1 WD40 repeat [Micromonospora krabiensis]
MGRPERPLDPEAGALQQFALDLRRLRATAGLTYRQLARRAHFSVTTLSKAASGEVVPSLQVTLAYVAACDGDRDEWTARWHALVAELASAEKAQVSDDRGPYRGMAAFQQADAEWFFGRERLVSQLCDMLTRLRFVTVFAPSGAGKSSLLRAGLLAAVADGSLAGGRDWATLLMTPGDRPADALAVRLAREQGQEPEALRQALAEDPSSIRSTVERMLADRPPTANLLIVVDQFEEVFTLCRDERERSTFVAALLAAAEAPRARVVLGVRADFYGQCAAYPALVAALHDHQVLVGPMDDDDLRRTITGPAERAGLLVDPALVEVAVAEAGGQVGALPLLSHALLETWRLRQDKRLTLARYREAGGVNGAIARTAERVYAQLSEGQRRQTREIFLRLTALGDGTEDTRRRAPLAELVGGADPTAGAEALARLTAARLVTADEHGFTVAHEALIQEWPRLRRWLTEDRELLRAHRRLTEAAAEWDRHDRADGFLYRGVQLALWEARQAMDLNDLERVFLAASRARDARERRAGRRRTTVALAALAATVVVVSVLAAVALVQADRAGAERDLAVSRQLTVEAGNQLQIDPRQAQRLATRALTTRPTLDAEMVLRQAVVDDRLRSVLPMANGEALGVVFSADGTQLAATGADGEVRIWTWTGQDAAGPGVVLDGGPTGQVWSPVFSPDGTRLATAGSDGTVRIWRVGQTGPPTVLRGHQGPVWGVAFSPDGRLVASAGEDTTVRVWDARGVGEPLVLRGHTRPAVGVAFSPDGRQLASSGHDTTVRLWDLAARSTSRVLTGPSDATRTLVFSADGTRLACSSSDGTAWVWPLAGRAAPVVLRGHEGTVEGLALSPDEQWFATTSDDLTVRVWSARGGGDPLVLRGHTNRVWAVAFSPDGSRLVSAADDGTVRVWDPGSDRQTLRGHGGAVWSAAFTPDGQRLVSGGEDGAVRVWDLTGRAEPRVVGRHDGDIYGLTVSPDGTRVASGGKDGTVRVWDLAGEREPMVFRGHEKQAWIADFSPDGRYLASVSNDKSLRIWDVTGGGEPVVHRAAEEIRYAAFSPDGTTVATAGAHGTLQIWDALGDAAPRLLPGHEGLVWAVAFSPDGRKVASSGFDGTVQIHSLTRDAAPVVLRGHEGPVWHVSFSPDGQWVLSSGKDGTARLWRASEAARSVTFTGFGASVETVDFSPDGERLVSTHDDGTVRVWPCRACAPVRSLLAESP